MSTRRVLTLPVRSAFVAVACLALGTALAGCDGDSTESAADPSGQAQEATPSVSAADSPSEPTTATPSESPADPESESPAGSPGHAADGNSGSTSESSPPTPEAETIAYAGGESAGVLVRGPADTDDLHGAPASFKRFIGRAAAKVVDQATCSDAAVGITVQFLRPDGYATGGVNECGGYAALWAIVDGRWKEIQGTQEIWSCAVLEKYRVPSDVAGTSCYDYDADKERSYRQA